MHRRPLYTLAATLFVVIVCAAGFAVHQATSHDCAFACVYTPPVVAAAPEDAIGAPPSGAPTLKKAKRTDDRAPIAAATSEHTRNIAASENAESTATTDEPIPNIAASAELGPSTDSSARLRSHTTDCCVAVSSHDPSAAVASSPPPPSHDSNGPKVSTPLDACSAALLNLTTEFTHALSLNIGSIPGAGAIDSALLSGAQAACAQSEVTPLIHRPPKGR